MYVSIIAYHLRNQQAVQNKSKQKNLGKHLGIFFYTSGFTYLFLKKEMGGVLSKVTSHPNTINNYEEHQTDANDPVDIEEGHINFGQIVFLYQGMLI